jgi:hypothetical protein
MTEQRDFGDAAWNQPDAPSPDWRQPPPTSPATGAWSPNPYQPSNGPAAWPPATVPAAARPTNLLAILSLIFAFVFPPVGLVLGFVARQQIRQRQEGGDGLALAGLIIGIIFTASYLMLCLIGGALGDS